MLWIGIAAVALIMLGFFVMRTRTPEPALPGPGPAPAPPAAEPKAEPRAAAPAPAASLPEPAAPSAKAEAKAASDEPAKGPAKLSRRDEDEQDDADMTVMRPLDTLPSEARKASAARVEPEEEDVDATVMRKVPLEVLAAAREAAISSRPPPAPAGAQGGDQDDPSSTDARVLVSGSACTDVGKRRKRNEDSHALLADRGLFLVCDGMGGHAGGDVASQLAIDTIVETLGPGHADRMSDRGQELVAAVNSASEAIYRAAEREPTLKGMGTTVVALRFSLNKTRAYVAHVGDSRIYRIRGGKLERLTRDHTYEEQVGVKGPIGAQLTQAVGVATEVDVDLLVDRPEVGDLYLLCSDGLTKMVTDDGILDLVSQEPELQACAERLVALANEKGGRDNVTIVLVRVDRVARS